MADIDAPLSWRMQQDGYLMQINQLRDENSKLREMVADMWRSAMMYCDFAERCAFADEFVDRMRELMIGGGLMSRTTAVMLKDRLNDIERNIYDGIDFRQELNEAYALADELEDENAKLIVKLNAEHIVRQSAEAENARLREELEQWHRLTAGIELPEYPVTEFKPKDIERENAKLRELCADVWHLFTKHSAVHPCDLSVVDDVRNRMQELGIEVSE